MQKTPTLLLAAAFLALGSARAASAGAQDFKLVNKTGVEINNLHISSVDEADWEEDVLGKDVLGDGESMNITFPREADECLWDMMVKDAEGTEVVWENINLCKTSVVVLHCDKKNCYATFD